MRQPRAFLAIRPGVHYRSDAFANGLGRIGYRVYTRTPQSDEIEPDSVLITWNRSAFSDPPARMIENLGGKVIVSENGYLGKDENGRQLYAMALGHHNGAGTWREGGPERWAALDIALKPWRESGKHILILGQRGIGHSSVAMPKGWDRLLTRSLPRRTKRPVRFRPHPGKDGVHGQPAVPLKNDLKDCHAVVTWNSGAGLRAIVAGVPVFYGFPKWIGATAGRPLDHDLEDPFLGDRLPMLRRLAWSQFTLAEITTGEPFRRLLG